MVDNPGANIAERVRAKRKLPRHPEANITTGLETHAAACEGSMLTTSEESLVQNSPQALSGSPERHGAHSVEPGVGSPEACIDPASINVIEVSSTPLPSARVRENAGTDDPLQTPGSGTDCAAQQPSASAEQQPGTEEKERCQRRMQHLQQLLAAFPCESPE